MQYPAIARTTSRAGRSPSSKRRTASARSRAWTANLSDKHSLVGRRRIFPERRARLATLGTFTPPDATVDIARRRLHRRG